MCADVPGCPRDAGEAAQRFASSTRPGGRVDAVLHALKVGFRLASSKAHLLPMDSVEAAVKAGQIGKKHERWACAHKSH